MRAALIAAITLALLFGGGSAEAIVVLTRQ
jgi:hypothetical protein